LRSLAEQALQLRRLLPQRALDLRAFDRACSDPGLIKVKSVTNAPN
jgi:hypothetical protein